MPVRAGASRSPADARHPGERMTEEEAELVVQQAALKAHAIATAKPHTEPIARPAWRAASEVAVVSQDQIDEYERRLAAARRAEQVERCRAGTRLPERYREASLDNTTGLPDDVVERYAHAVEHLRMSMANPGIYALIGSIGAGKTYLACGLINAFVPQGRSARYLKCGDYVRDYRATWRSDRAGAEHLYEAEHVRLSLLVLDEWQVRRDTSDENLILLRLLDKRYENNVTTVLIGNHSTPEEFERSIDARIADRMCDGGHIIHCDWQSVRGRIKG